MDKEQRAKLDALAKMAEQNFAAQDEAKMAPTGALRGALQGAMADEGSALEGLKRGWQKPAEAPTAFDLASQAGDKLDIQNPYALSALATLAEVGTDPTNLIPGGGAGKAAGVLAPGSYVLKRAAKMPKLYKAGKETIRGKSTAEALEQMQKLRKEGKDVPKVLRSLDANKGI